MGSLGLDVSVSNNEFFCLLVFLAKGNMTWGLLFLRCSGPGRIGCAHQTPRESRSEGRQAAGELARNNVSSRGVLATLTRSWSQASFREGCTLLACGCVHGSLNFKIKKPYARP